MDLQLIIVISIVAAAATYIGLATWRSLHRSKGGCGKGGCACPGPSGAAQSAKSNGLIPSDQLTLRHRNDPSA
jgi:hypothetical protein